VALSSEREAAPKRRSQILRLGPEIVICIYDFGLFLVLEDLLRSHINFINLNPYLSTERKEKKRKEKTLSLAYTLQNRFYLAIFAYVELTDYPSAVSICAKKFFPIGTLQIEKVVIQGIHFPIIE